MNNKQLKGAIEHCLKIGMRKAVFVVPFPISVHDVAALRNHGCCASMILRNPDSELRSSASEPWLGYYAPDEMSWRLPGVVGKFIFVGPSSMLTPQMVSQLRQCGASSVVCEQTPQSFVRIPLYRFKLWHLGDRIINGLSNTPSHAAPHRVLRYARRIPGAPMVWRKLFRRNAEGNHSYRAIYKPVDDVALDIHFFRRLLSKALKEAANKPYYPVEKKIILVNAGLAAGGAERQIANTLIGLKKRGYEDLLFLGEYLHRGVGLDFHLPLLLEKDIAAEPVGRSINLYEKKIASISDDLMNHLFKLPGLMPEEILCLIEDFRSRCPEVVHAWQDSTSIKVAIAGLVAGVPRIVLGGRNLIPKNFAYYQEYMQPAYKALTEMDHIVFLNNSKAGAKDYSRWLNVSADRFHVVANGIEFNSLVRSSKDVLTTYKKELGIPADAPVLGSVYRFWSEKRPMLWLETARKIATKLPNAHFLVIGDGPMRGEMEAFIRKTGLNDRFHLPGARGDIAMPLSAMTAFLLTSEFEGTPNVVLEAQWLGVPVVATNAGGTRETIDEGVTGWCCTESDPDALAESAIQILSQPMWQDMCSTAGPSFVRKNFGLDRMIDETLDLYFERVDAPLQTASAGS